MEEKNIVNVNEELDSIEQDIANIKACDELVRDLCIQIFSRDAVKQLIKVSLICTIYSFAALFVTSSAVNMVGAIIIAFYLIHVRNEASRAGYTVGLIINGLLMAGSLAGYNFIFKSFPVYILVFLWCYIIIYSFLVIKQAYDIMDAL